jgi:gamma-glutamyltranspeptidase/glutathione hydrolase
MRETLRARRGMVVAPHHLAAGAGLAVLREGGNAIEAMVAAAAAIAVVYPHMNGLGGDNFWLIDGGGDRPLAIDACGAAAQAATPARLAEAGHADALPSRGPLAALTVAGAVSGWQQALEISRQWGGRLPLARLLEDAAALAREGFAVGPSLARNLREQRGALQAQPGFAPVFLPQGLALQTGERLALPALAGTLEHLGRAGLDDFYRGELARSLAADLQGAGSLLELADLQAHRARLVEPLAVSLPGAMVHGLPPPTQGLASLMILGQHARLPRAPAESAQEIHNIVEATKRAFFVRDAQIADPSVMRLDAAAYLSAAALEREAAAIDPGRALPWPQAAAHGDTVWLGAVDAQGRAVSFIQSIYWEFGSGVVLPASGMLWQNRGTAFSLDPRSLRVLAPGRRPFHTIQPALARLADGRVMPYGTMGGEGQPQTQAAVFTRYAVHGQQLQQAVSAPRWLLGRTWGDAVHCLRVEDRFDPAVAEGLRSRGHELALVGPWEEMMGHAGALVAHRGSGPRAGLIEGAADPRSEGAVCAW